MPKTLPVIDMTDPICCAPVSASPLDDAAALEIALRLKALADPARIKLMSILLTDAAVRCAPVTWRLLSDCLSPRSATTSDNSRRPAWSCPSAAA